MKDNLEDLLSPNLWRSLACETVGTLVIVLLGCGAWIQWGVAAVNVVQVALAFGLAVATMLWCFAHISGGHFNPALTAATLVTRRVSIVRGLLYVVAQVVGAVLGAGVLYGLTPAGLRGHLGATVIPVHSQLTAAQAFGVEFLITFVFVLAFFSSRDSDRSDLGGSYPLTVGLAVVVCHLFAINYTMAGMNCARSFGPAVISGVWDDHWVYWVGPLAGGVLAGLLYDYVFAAGATAAKARKCLLRTKKFSPSQAAAAPQEKAPLDDAAAAEVIEIDETKALTSGEGEKEASAGSGSGPESDKAKLAAEENTKE